MRLCAASRRTMAFRLALSFLALAAVSRGQASLPGDLPSCVTTCYNAKLSEASWLVPGVGNADLAALCASGAFVQAFQNCLSDNCVRRQTRHEFETSPKY